MTYEHPVRRVIGKIGRRLKASKKETRETEADVENPIQALYNRAITHPATTIGLIAATIGVGAAIAFVLAEQRAQKGIDRQAARDKKRRTP